MTRDQALQFVEEKIADRNVVKHMLATEAVMKALAGILEPDKVEEWGLAGLLHDADYSENVPVNRQGIEVCKWLGEAGFAVSEEVKHAMAAHNAANNGVTPVSKMDWALFAGDSLTGLIVASALVMPSRKLSDLAPGSVMKRFKEPSFARGTRREDIRACEQHLGVPLEEFVRISLTAMQGIAHQLGL